MSFREEKRENDRRKDKAFSLPNADGHGKIICKYFREDRDMSRIADIALAPSGEIKYKILKVEKPKSTAKPAKTAAKEEKPAKKTTTKKADK